MKCTYKFSEGCVPRLRGYIKCCRSWLNNSYRYEFLLVFLNSFFKLLYYSYEMHVQIFRRLRPTDTRLHQVWVKLVEQQLQVRVFAPSGKSDLDLFCLIFSYSYIKSKLSRIKQNHFNEVFLKK